ncbi:hypothetical protein THAOC_13676, partial [Thalassiosira oceanica]
SETGDDDEAARAGAAGAEQRKGERRVGRYNGAAERPDSDKVKATALKADRYHTG